MLLIAVYAFVFTLIIPVRSGGHSYILFLMSGIIPWLAINEGLVRSATSVVDNASIVRRLPLRSAVLVIVPNASALLLELVALTLFVVALTAMGEWPRGLWLLPFALAAQMLLQIGVGLFLAAAHVFFRDVTQLLAFALSVVFYLSPILYPAGGRFERLLVWNPLTPLLGLFRSAVLGAPLPPAGSIVFLSVVAVAVAYGSFLFFRSAQRVFVDII
jgi:lipopolysaccharide transport system permease protein